MKNRHLPWTIPLLLLLFSLSITSAFGQSVVLNSLEDATVYSSRPDVTHNGNNLFVYNFNEDSVAESYLKFDIEAFAGYVANDVSFSIRGKAGSNYDLFLYEVKESWGADTITFADSLSYDKDTLASFEINDDSKRRSFTNTGEFISIINKALASGKSTISFVIKAADGSTGEGMWMGSQEDGSYAPQLTINLLQKVNSSAEDVTVFSAHPDSTYNDNNMYVYNDGGEEAVSFLRFNVKDHVYQTASSAGISLRGVAATGEEYTIYLFEANSKWMADTVTYANHPSIKSDTLATYLLTGSSARRSFENNGDKLLAFINNRLSKGDTAINFALKAEAGAKAGGWIGSQEDGSYGPQLDLVFEETTDSPNMDVSVFSAHPDSTHNKNNLFVYNDGVDSAFAFIQFDISKYANYQFNDVALSVRATKKSADDAYFLHIFSAGNDWMADTVDYANRPSNKKDTLATFDLSTSSARRDFSNNGSKFVSYVNKALANGDSLISIYLGAHGAGAAAANLGFIGSEEDGSYGPQLTFKYSRGAATPEFNPGVGTFTNPVTVALFNQPPGEVVYYTTDGTDPDSTDTEYPAEGLTFAETTILKAVAYRDDEPGEIFTGVYEVIAGKPVFDPLPGEFTNEVTVSLSTPTEGATIYYTVDDSDPTAASLEYTGPIALTATATVKAVAIKGDMVSEIVSGLYTVVVTTAGPGTGPGGVGFKDKTRAGQPQNSLWLQADAGVTLEDGKVALWADQSGNENHATDDYAGTQPAFYSHKLPAGPQMAEEEFNGMPAINFGSNVESDNAALLVEHNDNLNVGTGIAVFTVLRRNKIGDFQQIMEKRNEGGDRNWVLETDGGEGNLNQIAFKLNQNQVVKHTTTKFDDTDSIHLVNFNYGNDAGMFAYVNGKFEGANVQPKTIVPSQAPLVVSRSGLFDIAETVLYSEMLNAAQVVIVQNYLAAKYKLPLIDAQGNDANLYTSNTYNGDVIGIGKDVINDIEGTHSASSGGGLVMEVNGDISLGQYLFAGHNKVTHGLGENDIWERKWNLEKTGSEAFPVKLSFDFEAAGLEAPASAENYVLSYDDGSGFAALEATPTLEDGMISFTLDDVSNGVYAFGQGVAAEKVANPTFSPTAGEYIPGERISISTSTEGATVYYTMDGTEPTESSTEYTEPIVLLAEDITLKARAFKEGSNPSDIVEAMFLANVAGADDLVTQIRVYPNPVTDYVKIELPEEYSGATSIALMDNIGRILSSRNVKGMDLSDGFTLGTSNLPSGIYFLRISNGNTKSAVIKLIRD